MRVFFNGADGRSFVRRERNTELLLPADPRRLILGTPGGPACLGLRRWSTTREPQRRRALGRGRGQAPRPRRPRRRDRSRSTRRALRAADHPRHAAWAHHHPTFARGGHRHGHGRGRTIAAAIRAVRAGLLPIIVDGIQSRRARAPRHRKLRRQTATWSRPTRCSSRHGYGVVLGVPTPTSRAAHDHLANKRPGEPWGPPRLGKTRDTRPNARPPPSRRLFRVARRRGRRTATARARIVAAGEADPRPEAGFTPGEMIHGVRHLPALADSTGREHPQRRGEPAARGAGPCSRVEGVAAARRPFAEAAREARHLARHVRKRSDHYPGNILGSARACRPACASSMCHYTPRRRLAALLHRDAGDRGRRVSAARRHQLPAFSARAGARSSFWIQRARGQQQPTVMADDPSDAGRSNEKESDDRARWHRLAQGPPRRAARAPRASTSAAGGESVEAQ